MTYAFSYPDLPIMVRRDDILKALENEQVLIVQGGTGSGKTTQLPKFLLEAGFAERGLIGVTQPRRIAALSITDRLRQETTSTHLIGAKIRFHDDMPKGAKIKVMTDGILLQEFRRDPLMRQYACIILDEAHERSLNVDILLGIFKNILPRRPEFRLVVTSATLDANRFAVFFGTEKNPASVVEVEGRQFPVSLEYWDLSGKNAEDEDEEGRPARAFPPMEAAAIAIRELQSRRPDNLLAFLPTEKEIHELHRELEKDLGKSFSILPLYGRLGPVDQRKVFEEGGRPKIILATNIAETSLTIPGIGYVVDMGLARVSRYHPHTKIQGLPIERISQASARQRSGRAGRVKPGICVRLYSEADLLERVEFTEPEILRSNLANVVLQLLALGLPVATFPFPDPPSPTALRGAFRQLHELGGVSGPDVDASLTEEGFKLSRLPVDVAIGKILLTATELGALQPALILAAGITVQDPRFTPREEPEKGKAVGLHRRFEDPRSDFMGVLALWVWIHRQIGDTFSQRRLRALCIDNFLSYNRIREWIELTDQFCRLLKVTVDPASLNSEAINSDAFHKSILAGFMPFLARKKPEDISYRLAGDKEAFLHPGSGLVKRKPEWIVAGEVRQTSRVFIFRACEIKPAWIEDLVPDACKRSYLNIAWNGERGFVEALERVTYKGFAIRQDRRVNYESVAPEECAEIFWREGVVRQGLNREGMAPAVSQAAFPFLEHNRHVLESLTSLERKARMHGLVPDEDHLVHWYRQRAPSVTSRIRLETFLKDAAHPSLEFSLQEWTGPLKNGDWESWLLGNQSLADLFPETLESQGSRYRISYRFDFGDALDGISLETDPDGLATLSLADLIRGIPGWRKWIWEFCLEKLGSKAAQVLRGLTEQIVKAWVLDSASMDMGSGGAVISPATTSPASISPARALLQGISARCLANGIEWPVSTLTLPTTWAAFTQIHIFTTSSNGRRFLMHVDPAQGECEFFAAKRKILFGDSTSNRPWEEWANSEIQNFGTFPYPVAGRGFAFGVDPLNVSSGILNPNPQHGGCFHQLDQALFYRRIANSMIAKPISADAKIRSTLVLFFTRRLQTLMDVYSVPDRVRKQTEKWVSLLCSVWLPAWYLEAYGMEAPTYAEQDLPAPRLLTHLKSGAPVKSLASLSQTVAKGNESGTWAGFSICIGAALVSRSCFLHWYATMAQPPLQSKKLIEEILRESMDSTEGLEMLVTPFYAAWLAKTWESRLPESVLRVSIRDSEINVPNFKNFATWNNFGTEDLLPAGSREDARRNWMAKILIEEQNRKAAKGIRDRFCNRIASLGQNVGGLPLDLRESLGLLDKPVPWSAKILAEIELELYLNKTAGKVGTVVGADPKAEAGKLVRKEQLLRDLTQRKQKL